MRSLKLALRTVACFCFFLCIALVAQGLLPPDLANSEEVNGTTLEEEVDGLLKQLDNGEKIIETSAKLYRMGPEIDQMLLKKLSDTDVTTLKLPYTVSETIVTILSSRGYDREVLDILKSRLMDRDPKNRISAAVILALNYNYYAVRDLASIVSGEGDPEHISERSMYEWSARSAEIVIQILEVLQGKSQIAKDFVISFLKAIGTECSECGYDVEKWKVFLESEAGETKYLGSDWFEDRELTGSEVVGIGGLTSSPDGKKIAIVWRHISDGKFDTDLWTMDTSTNRITEIQIPGSCYRPSWSPRGNMIVFQNTTAKGINVCTIREDGSDCNVWTKSFRSNNGFQAQWSPNDLKIGFIKFYNLPHAIEIQMIDLVGNKVHRVVGDNFCTFLGNRFHTTWCLSKDGKIYFWDCYGDDKATAGLYSAPLDAPEQRELVHGFDLDPTYVSMALSPKGDKLAYVQNDSALFIYDFLSKESREFELCNLDSYAYLGSYAWTPDGESIVLVKYAPKEDGQTFILSLETGELTELVNASFSGEPFGPDGKSIYYTRYDEQAKKHSIWRINLDGTNDTKIFPVEGTEHTTVQAVPILKWAERD
jgi:Tol biopolymer transport system component